MTTRRTVRLQPRLAFGLSVSGCLFLPALLACDASRAAPAANVDSNVGPEPETGSAFYCREAVEPQSADHQVPASFARTTAPVLALANYQTELSWQPSTLGHSYNAEQDAAQLTLSIDSLSAVEVVIRSPANRDPSGSVPSHITSASLGCVDTLRTTVTGKLSTTGGSLDEGVSFVMEAMPSGVWLGQVELALASLSGSFNASLTLPDGYTPIAPPILRASLGIAFRTLVGDLELLSGELLDGTGMTRDAGVRERIAHFPPGNLCGPEFTEVSRAQMERRTAMSSAIAQLNEAQPVMMIADETSSPTGVLELQFQAADDDICLSTDNSVENVLLTHAQLNMRSADGRIDGAITTDIVVLHEPARIEASAQLVSQEAEFNAGLPARFGILDVLDLEPYEGTSVELVAGLADTASWGSLQVVGRSSASCGASALPADAGLHTNTGLSADAAAPLAAPCDEQRLWGIHWGEVPE